MGVRALKMGTCLLIGDVVKHVNELVNLAPFAGIAPLEGMASLGTRCQLRYINFFWYLDLNLFHIRGNNEFETMKILK